MISSVEGWLKGRLAEAGFGHIGVRRLDGNAGAWTTHWKCVQTAGRVGRDMSQPAAYITVVEKKSFARGALVEREIHRAVLFES